MSENINSGKLLLRELFDNYSFVIPSFQRPYVWDKENVIMLLEDINAYFFEDIESREEYFLGSFVFCKKNDNNCNKRIEVVDVIDGQQRLTTLLLIFTVIRDLTKDKDVRNTMNEYIMTAENKIKNQDEVRRITYEIREDLEDFLSENIYYNVDSYSDKDIQKKYVNNKYYKSNNINVRNMYNALKTIKEYFDDKEDVLYNYTKNLSNHVFAIYIKAQNRADAFRFFMILNNRGVPLQTSDLLKTENLEVINNSDEEEIYAKKWEDIESSLKGDKFDRFLGLIRAIYLKKNVTKSLYDEFQKIYTDKENEHDKIQKGKNFFRIIEKYYEDYMEIIELEKYSLKKFDSYRNLIYILMYFQTEEWKSPLLFFYDKFKKEIEDETLLQFLKKVEENMLCDIIVGKTPSERNQHVYEIIRLIEKSSSPEDVLNGAELENINKKRAKEIIKNEGIYGKRFVKYLLLKYEYLCAEVSSNNFDKISIEHVLPQNPKNNSKWLDNFSEEAIEKWVDNIANLVIISGSKNSSLSNLDFDEKKEKFINSGKISNYAGAMKVFNKKTWTPKELEERNSEMINLLFGEE